MISQKHANFIVNTGNATAEDVRALIAYAQEQVYKHNGIMLEPEVIFVGNFSTPLFTA
jgi:UDP-N-acetylmuramate dehydrogenase